MKQIVATKPFVAFLTMAVIAVSSFTVNAQRANLSGDWKLNEAKSELGEFRMAADIIKAEQKEDAISLTRTTPGFNGGDPTTATLVMPFDGKEVASEGFAGSKRISTAKWSEDGKTLVISSITKFERDGETFEFKSTENWTLADGVLTIATNTTSPRGDSSTKAVYTK